MGQEPGRSTFPSAHRRKIGAFCFAEQVDLRQRCAVVGNHGIEDAYHSPNDALDLVLREQIRQVLRLEVQLIVHRRHQSQRVVRRVGAQNVGDLEAGDIRLLGQSGPIDRVRLEHGQGVERDAVARGALDVRQTEVVVIE